MQYLCRCSWRLFLQISCIPIDLAFAQWAFTNYLPPLHWPWNAIHWIKHRRTDIVIVLTFATIAVVAIFNLIAIAIIATPFLREHTEANIEELNFCPFSFDRPRSEWSSFDVAVFDQSATCDVRNQYLDDLMADFNSRSIVTLREMDNATIAVNVAFVRAEYDSGSTDSASTHSEWDDRFWTLVDAMEWNEPSIFEHVAALDQDEWNDGSAYLAVTKVAVFSDAGYVSMGIVVATWCFFVYHFWAYHAVLALFPSLMDRALYWVHVLMLWFQCALIDAEEEWGDRCYDYNLQEVVSRITSQITQRTATVAALEDSGMFPQEIERLIEDMLFHDVVREIAVETVMVKVLGENMGFDHGVAALVGSYLHGEASMNSIQIHYPLGLGGHLKGRFKCPSSDWAAMRFIRLVVVYQPTHQCVQFDPFFHANGRTLELDMASRELVVPQVVIQ